MNPFNFLINFFLFLLLLDGTIHMMSQGNFAGFYLIPLFFLIKISFKDDENFWAVSGCSFFLFPFAVTGFISFTIIYFYPHINEYLFLIIIGIINFFLFCLSYFCLEFKYNEIFYEVLNQEGEESEDKVKKAEEAFGKFLDRVRISVDLVRLFTGSIGITLFGLFVKKIDLGNLPTVLHYIGQTPGKLGAKSSEIIEYLPYVLYGAFLPSVLGATVIKIYADFLKYKKRPSLCLENKD